MQQFCSSISRQSIASGRWASVTLTYHLLQVTPIGAKVHLKSFAAAMRRQWGPLGTIWKLEAQERGAPHFHLLVQLGNVVQVDAFASWATEAWHAIAEPESPLHLRWHRGELGNGNKHCVHPVQDFEEFLYASKYASKPQGQVAGWDWPGRYWGKWSEDQISVTVPQEDVPKKIGYRVLRSMRRWRARRERSLYTYYPGFCLDGVHYPGLKAKSKLSPEKLGLHGKLSAPRRCRRRSQARFCYLPPGMMQRVYEHEVCQWAASGGKSVTSALQLKPVASDNVAQVVAVPLEGTSVERWIAQGEWEELQRQCRENERVAYWDAWASLGCGAI